MQQHHRGRATMYLELINLFRTTRKYGNEIKPQAPASMEEIFCAEQQTGIQFPQELRDLLLEMNGDCNLFFSLEEIINYTACQCSKHYPPGSLLFFGGDGAGNLFAYQVKESKAAAGKIYLWEHEIAVFGPEEDELEFQAVSLTALIQDYYGNCYQETL